MKIATWNVDRPNSSSQARNKRILDAILRLNADILVLTETSSLIHPGAGYISGSSTPLLGASFRKKEQYSEGENRVTIWSKYPAAPIKTYNPNATACARVQTPRGELIVYGTVIGIYGRGNPEFTQDLESQINDWRTLFKNDNLCIAGDFNQTLGDDLYFTKSGRQRLEECFDDFRLDVPTSSLPNNVDHIALSKLFPDAVPRRPEVWNSERKKTVSSHQGTCVTL